MIALYTAPRTTLNILTIDASLPRYAYRPWTWMRKTEVELRHAEQPEDVQSAYVTYRVVNRRLDGGNLYKIKTDGMPTLLSTDVRFVGTKLQKSVTVYSKCSSWSEYDMDQVIHKDRSVPVTSLRLIFLDTNGIIWYEDRPLNIYRGRYIRILWDENRLLCLSLDGRIEKYTYARDSNELSYSGVLWSLCCVDELLPVYSQNTYVYVTNGYH